ncbi:M15 family metallopeptidase [Ectobacillus antri]|uniref:M15 family metallopeptidase n=1 Tax=Ectobacillus antri TaxID=2486280 RepID=A0ABT6H469_9BACI|nr:M15 family metallopeptidase [Ectobacillus antri]MDG4657522.1 M15 family metallopeptidase [Ectobacillus antri]MDG5753835.1 M15 family metallopeptidase [Ectobacillus antri]
MAFQMTYDKRNRTNLDQLAPNTKAAAYKWYQYCIDNKADILIYETIRTVERQRQYVAQGVSRTMQSYHLVGQALDFVPIVNGKDEWSRSAYLQEPYRSAIAYAKSLGFEWGGDWTDFVDNPHLQFNYKGYGTDKVLDSPSYKVIIPNTAFWQARGLVREFEGRGYQAKGVNLKAYGPNQQPAENDPYLFVIETDLENAKQLVIELKTRGYHLTYGEAQK